MTRSDRASVEEVLLMAVDGTVTLTCECENEHAFPARPADAMQAKRLGWRWKDGEITCPDCRSAWLKAPVPA